MVPSLQVPSLRVPGAGDVLGRAGSQGTAVSTWRCTAPRPGALEGQPRVHVSSRAPSVSGAGRKVGRAAECPPTAAKDAAWEEPFVGLKS